MRHSKIGLCLAIITGSVQNLQLNIQNSQHEESDEKAITPHPVPSFHKASPCKKKS
jgi:hypothetical protein